MKKVLWIVGGIAVVGAVIWLIKGKNSPFNKGSMLNAEGVKVKPKGTKSGQAVAFKDVNWRYDKDGRQYYIDKNGNPVYPFGRS